MTTGLFPRYLPLNSAADRDVGLSTRVQGVSHTHTHTHVDAAAASSKGRRDAVPSSLIRLPQCVIEISLIDSLFGNLLQHAVDQSSAPTAPDVPQPRTWKPQPHRKQCHHRPTSTPHVVRATTSADAGAAQRATGASVRVCGEGPVRTIVGAPKAGGQASNCPGHKQQQLGHYSGRRCSVVDAAAACRGSSTVDTSGTGTGSSDIIWSAKAPDS